jgi:hypothetical protein
MAFGSSAVAIRHSVATMKPLYRCPTSASGGYELNTMSSQHLIWTWTAEYTPSGWITSVRIIGILYTFLLQSFQSLVMILE